MFMNMFSKLKILDNFTVHQYIYYSYSNLASLRVITLMSKKDRVSFLVGWLVGLHILNAHW